MSLLTKAKVITTPTAYSDGILHSVKPNNAENLLLQSNTFDNGSWVGSAITKVGGQIGYDGSSDAWLLTSTLNYQSIVQNVSSSGVHTFSAYLKDNNIGLMQLRVNGSSFGLIDIDLTAGIISGQAGTTIINKGIESVGNGWYRAYIVVNDSVSSVQITFNDLSGTSFYIQDAQLNKGLTADQYIETTTETSPRADFTFTRNSSATRVNELGYIEDVQIIGGELVQNGDFEEIGSEEVTNGSFSDGGTYWTNGGLVTFADGKASFVDNGTNTYSYIAQTVFTASKTYKIEINISRLDGGQVEVLASGGTIGLFSDEGIKTIYHTASAGDILIKRYSASPNFDFDIDNVSVKEVGQDWTFFGDVTMGDGLVSFVSPTTTYSYIRQDIGSLSASNYRISIEVKNYVSGAVQAAFFGASTTVQNFNVTGDGVYTVELSPNANGDDLEISREFSGGAFDFDIDNISVKEVTDDTNLPRINYEGFSYEETLGDNLVVNGTFDTDSDWFFIGTANISGGRANFPDTTNSFIIQIVIPPLSVKQYAIQYEVTATNGGNLKLDGGSSAFGTYSLPNTLGVHTVYLQSNGTQRNLQFNNSGAFIGSIDNVSVQEVIGDFPIYGSGKGHLLLEGQSTNLFPYSEDFSQSDWSKVNVSITSNATISPDGTQNASLIYPNATSSGATYINDSISSTNSIYSISAFVKANGKNVAWLYIQSSSTYGIVYFDLSDQSIEVVAGSASTPTGTINDMGNGWYKVTLTTGSSLTLFTGSGIGVCDAKGSFSVTKNGTDGVYIYGLQIEQGNISSYIPTNGSAVTRAAETCNNAGNADLFDSEGVLYAEIAALANDGTIRYLSMSDGSSNNRVTILYDGTADRIRGIVSGGGTKHFDNNEYVTSALDFHKAAIRYKDNDYSLWIDGVQAQTASSGSAPTGIDRLEYDLNGGGAFYSKSKMVAVFPYLSNDEMECLTGEGYGSFESMALANNYTII